MPTKFNKLHTLQNYSQTKLRSITHLTKFLKDRKRLHHDLKSLLHAYQ